MAPTLFFSAAYFSRKHPLPTQKPGRSPPNPLAEAGLLLYLVQELPVLRLHELVQGLGGTRPALGPFGPRRRRGARGVPRLGTKFQGPSVAHWPSGWQPREVKTASYLPLKWPSPEKFLKFMNPGSEFKQTSSKLVALDCVYYLKIDRQWSLKKEEKHILPLEVSDFRAKDTHSWVFVL